MFYTVDEQSCDYSVFYRYTKKQDTILVEEWDPYSEEWFNLQTLNDDYDDFKLSIKSFNESEITIEEFNDLSKNEKYLVHFSPE